MATKEIIVKLNHIDLPVIDPANVRIFFESHFEMRCVFSREDGLTVLLDEDGSALTLSPLPPGELLKYPTGFHIGFNLDNKDELFELHGRIVAAGVPIVRPLGDLAGAMTFHCEAPGPILIEVAWRPRL
jgi:catechol 2,3-dioxygenase-like lactoylglutathione lyase family enzyme